MKVYWRQIKILDFSHHTKSFGYFKKELRVLWPNAEFLKMHWLPVVTHVARIPSRVRQCPSFADALDAVYVI